MKFLQGGREGRSKGVLDHTCTILIYLYDVLSLWIQPLILQQMYHKYVPHIPHRAPLQPCIRDGIRGTSLVRYMQMSGWETSSRRGKTMDTFFSKKLFQNPKSAAEQDGTLGSRPFHHSTTWDIMVDTLARQSCRLSSMPSLEDEQRTKYGRFYWRSLQLNFDRQILHKRITKSHANTTIGWFI
jgi:hypothetical protein